MKSNRFHKQLCAFLVTAACMPQAHADAKKMWVQGSWVNIRQSADMNAKVIDHLSTNTPVFLIAQKDKSCEISWGISGHGYIPCKFLADQVLVFADVATENSSPEKAKNYSPTRAFWIAPSMRGLFNAGKYFQENLLKPEQLNLENGSVQDRPEPQRPPKLIRYSVPEFEAMKEMMNKGVIAPVVAFAPLFSCEQMQEAKRRQVGSSKDEFTRSSNDWSAPDAEKYPYSYIYAHDCLVPEIPKLSLPKIKVSYFKDVQKVLPGNTQIEEISAKFGIVERGSVTGSPRWALDYDTYRYTGAWDIGSYTLTLDKPVYEHVIGRTGLVAVYRWLPGIDEEPFGPSASCEEGLRNQRNGKELLSGYPKVKDALLWFQSATPLSFRTAKINSRAYLAPARSLKEGEEQRGIKKVVVYEVDLDGDGIADFVQWDMWGEPEISGPSPLLTLRQIFININGVWHPFERDSYGECT
ncbi:SH3 domain-containing protein [Undibacterium flavidum]|uniref:SH3 domain-containing protein n=1 Tax=Undibacterium flavidum TaxID=2762297 RepID=A0ABR6YF27_9BURK|nr:hypothetical protein [Undibacterium flavidum]MBC3875184.1 hypothetical protein [Undibacterium flavidum]